MASFAMIRCESGLHLFTSLNSLLLRRPAHLLFGRPSGAYRKTFLGPTTRSQSNAAAATRQATHKAAPPQETDHEEHNPCCSCPNEPGLGTRNGREGTGEPFPNNAGTVTTHTALTGSQIADTGSAAYPNFAGRPGSDLPRLAGTVLPTSGSEGAIQTANSLRWSLFVGQVVKLGSPL
jgi:hypothetical protein